MSKSKFITVAQGVKLHVTDVGSGQPIVFIHGWPQSDEIFKFQYYDLTNRGYRVIGITLRGFGKSDKPGKGYTFDQFAEDIHSVIMNLDLKNVVLCGYSMGGAVAAKYLINHNNSSITKLVLISANVPRAVQTNNFHFGPSIEQIEHVIEGLKVARLILIDVYGPLFHLEKSFMPEELGKWINRIGMEASVEATVAGFEALRDLNMEEELSKIRVPVAIFHAINDTTVPFGVAEYAQKAIKGAKLIKFELGGHWIILLEQEKFLKEMIEFINK